MMRYPPQQPIASRVGSLRNLRVRTNAGNQRNPPKPKTTAKVASRFKGVSWDKCNEKWRAKILFDGKQRHLGTFEDEAAAARAYDAAAVKRFGEFARVNRVSENPADIPVHDW